MIEISITEIALFIWAIGATAMWLREKEQLYRAKIFLRSVLTNEEVRNHFVADFKKYLEESEANDVA